MEEMDDLKSVREIRREKREKMKDVLPVKKSAQKEFVRDWLAKNQEKFEKAMDQLLDYDPKTYVTIYKDLTKHMIPKQSEVSVTHGLDEDFKELVAFSRTKLKDGNMLDVERRPLITDADYEELNDMELYGSGQG